jgi:hypothetical protein
MASGVLAIGDGTWNGGSVGSKALPMRRRMPTMLPVPSANALLWNDIGIATGSAGRWDRWHDTAPGRGYRNAGIDFGGWINHALRPGQLIAQIGAAGSFSVRGHGQTADSRFATWVRRRRDRR